MDFAKTNSVSIVGRLIKCDLKTGNAKTDGRAYVSGTITVVSDLDGRDNEFTIDLFAYQQNNQGKESALYTKYIGLNNSLNQKVQVDGSLSVRRYFSTKANQLTSAQSINGRFIKNVAETTLDKAEFHLDGFVLNTLTEKKNKNNEIYRYDIKIGQSNYRGDNMIVYILNVDPSAREMVNGVQKMAVGATYELAGQLRSYTETQTIEHTGGSFSFGQPIVSTYVNTYRSYFITGGRDITGETAYNGEVVRNLIAAWKAEGVQIETAAKNRMEGAEKTSVPVENAAPIKNMQAALI